MDGGGGGGWWWLVFVKFKDRSEPIKNYINKLSSAEDRLWLTFKVLNFFNGKGGGLPHRASFDDLLM